MASQNIDFRIGTKADLAGFNQVQGALRSTGGNLRRVGSVAAQAIGQFEGLSGAAGKATRAISGLVGGALSGGVWGLVLAAVGAVVGGLIKLRDVMKESAETARLAGHAMSREFMTVEHGNQGYQRRVQLVRDEKKARDELARSARAAQVDDAKRAEAMNSRFREIYGMQREMEDNAKVAGIADKDVQASARREMDLRRAYEMAKLTYNDAAMEYGRGRNPAVLSARLARDAQAEELDRMLNLTGRNAPGKDAIALQRQKLADAEKKVADEEGIARDNLRRLELARDKAAQAVELNAKAERQAYAEYVRGVKERTEAEKGEKLLRLDEMRRARREKALDAKDEARRRNRRMDWAAEDAVAAFRVSTAQRGVDAAMALGGDASGRSAQAKADKALLDAINRQTGLYDTRMKSILSRFDRIAARGIKSTTSPSDRRRIVNELRDLVRQYQETYGRKAASDAERVAMLRSQASRLHGEATAALEGGAARHGGMRTFEEMQGEERRAKKERKRSKAWADKELKRVADRQSHAAEAAWADGRLTDDEVAGLAQMARYRRYLDNLANGNNYFETAADDLEAGLPAELKNNSNAIKELTNKIDEIVAKV